MPQLKNSRHEAFCLGIVKGEAAGAAYAAAGYSKRGADQSASQLLRNPKIAARIAELKEAAADATVMDRRETLQGLTLLARSNMLDYVGAHGQLLDISQLTREHGAAIHEVTYDTYMDGGGEEAREVKRVKLKLYDKRAALVDLGRHHGLFTDKHEVKVDIGSRLDAAIKRALG